jgi:hypothetical protein
MSLERKSCKTVFLGSQVVTFPIPVGRSIRFWGARKIRAYLEREGSRQTRRATVRGHNSDLKQVAVHSFSAMRS